MELSERIRDLLSGLPEGASVTLPRRVLVSWLEEAGGGAEAGARGPREDVADLTVPELADALGRAESTVRGWLPDVPGAYKLGGEWRVPRPAWRAYLDGLAQEEDEETPEVRSKRTAGLGDWRDRREDVA